MGRQPGKINIKFINNEKARVTSFATRMTGLKKKIHEFSTLCGVDACMVSYGPRRSDHLNELVIWPENQQEVCRIFNQYHQYYQYHVEDDGNQRRFDLTDYLKGQKENLENELVKMRQKNDEMDRQIGEDHVNGLSENQRMELHEILDSKIKTINAQIEQMKWIQSLPSTVTMHSQPNPPMTMNNYSNVYEDRTTRNQSYDMLQHPYLGDQVIRSLDGVNFTNQGPSNLQSKPLSSQYLLYKIHDSFEHHSVQDCLPNQPVINDEGSLTNPGMSMGDCNINNIYMDSNTGNPSYSTLQQLPYHEGQGLQSFGPANFMNQGPSMSSNAQLKSSQCVPYMMSESSSCLTDSFEPWNFGLDL